jgi:short-subunit dehydrogenase
MANFADQVIAITGASAGIGRALALELAVERPKLILAARSHEKLEAVADRCRSLGAAAIAVPTDVTQRDQCEQFVQRGVEHFGRLDVLVNNAGQLMWSRFDELTNLAVIENILRVNFLGGVYTTHFALPHLEKTRGLIVAMSSIAGLVGVPRLSGYAASKHAIIGFYESLRIELAGTGVDVTIVAPDFTQSEILDHALGPAGEPLPANPLDLSRYPTAEACARRTIAAMKRRERMALSSLRAIWSRVGKLVVPGLVDRIAAGAVGLQ